MLLYIKIAIRNVHKNLRSMTFNGIGIVITAMLLVFIFSFSRGIETQIVQRNIRFETGGITVLLNKELTGWENQTEGELLYRKFREIANNIPEVTGCRIRISIGNASIYAEDATERIQVEGIGPPEWGLLNEIVSVMDGGTDWTTTPNGILISKELSEETGLATGYGCFIVLPSADGSVNMQEFTVTGIFQNTSPADKYRTYMSYEQAKELYHVNLPTRILVDLTHLDEAETVAGSLKEMIASSKMEIKTYKDFMGRAQALSSINRNGFLGVAFFLLFISFVGIWAMTSEQVNDRRKEMGTLLTLGFSHSSVKCIFLLETVYMSVIFLVMGICAILVIIGIIEYRQGIYLGRLAAFAFGSSTVLPEFQFRDVGITVITCLFYPMLATWLSLQAMSWKSIVKLLN